MGFIVPELNYKLNELVGDFFAMNRMLDRAVSLLNIRFKMINTSKLVHETAHMYPGDDFADGVSAYQAERDMETIYPATPIGNEEWESPIAIFEDYLDACRELELKIRDAADMASRLDDRISKKFLNNLGMKMAGMTAKAKTFYDVVKICDNDPFKLLMLDAEIDDFFGD